MNLPCYCVDKIGLVCEDNSTPPQPVSMVELHAKMVTSSRAPSLPSLSPEDWSTAGAGQQALQPRQNFLKLFFFFFPIKILQV